MSSQLCTFYLKNTCNRGTSCGYSHREPVPETKSSRSSEICHYYVVATCVFGDRCQRSHKGDSKKANASHSHNEGSSDSYESPVDNGMVRSDKRSASEGEGEDEDEDVDIQENPRDNLPIGHMLDPIPPEVDEEYAKSDVLDSGPSRNDTLNLPSHINIGKEKANKEACVFFLEGICGNGGCDFSHSTSKNTKTASSSRLKGPNLSKSYLYSSFSIPDHVAHRVAHCSKALRLVMPEGLHILPSGALPIRERL